MFYEIFVKCRGSARTPMLRQPLSAAGRTLPDAYPAASSAAFPYFVVFIF